jgi:dolichol-phosphate mannosyltransferase
MPAAPELVAIIPVYNEVERVADLARTWIAALDGANIPFELHFYDDGSRDGSSERLAALHRDDPRVVTHRHDNRGHGPTVSRGYVEHADTPWILQLDADDTIGPGLLTGWWLERTAYDLMMASRQDPARSGFRRGLTVLARTAVRLLFGAGVRDVNAPYRLIRTSACRDAFALLQRDTLLPNVWLTGFACRRQLRIHQDDVAVAGRKRRESLVSTLRWIRLAMRGCAQLAPMAAKVRRV